MTQTMLVWNPNESLITPQITLAKPMPMSLASRNSVFRQVGVSCLVMYFFRV